MFSTGANHLPGQALKQFEVFRTTKTRTQSGRAMQGEEAQIGELKGILAQAKPEEKERWRQLSHPVTHKIIQEGKPDFQVRPSDILRHGHRKFYISAIPYDVGGLGHWSIYYCEERSDLHG